MRIYRKNITLRHFNQYINFATLIKFILTTVEALSLAQRTYIMIKGLVHNIFSHVVRLVSAFVRLVSDTSPFLQGGVE